MITLGNLLRGMYTVVGVPSMLGLGNNIAKATFSAETLLSSGTMLCKREKLRCRPPHEGGFLLSLLAYC